jgi:hypothetical protein
MATLKISDLSVGDWVNVMTEKLTSLVFCEEIEITRGYIHSKIKGIREEGFIAVETADSRYTLVDIGCIGPIPITPEILDANGWQRNEEVVYMEYYGDPTSGISHTKGTYHYRLETPETSVVCYFVHQLQHALRLAGVDKEINL